MKMTCSWENEESYSTGTERMQSGEIGFNYKSLNCKEQKFIQNNFLKMIIINKENSDSTGIQVQY